MTKKPSYFALGATLYTPCTHEKLAMVMQQSLQANSMVFCTEDAVADKDVAQSLANLKQALIQLVPDSTCLRFIRPRNARVLSEILTFPGIEKMDGFVLPKYDLSSAPAFHDVLQKARHPFYLMPTLETLDVLEPAKLPLLRQQLDHIKQQVLCLRIGGNDLMSLIGMKRMKGFSAYDTPLKTIIDQLVLAFRPYGYELSAPVFDFIDDEVTLVKELVQDTAYGFFNKTAIHPLQVERIQRHYRTFSQQYQGQADHVISDQAAAVYQLEGQMFESTCHRNWAERTSQLVANLKS